MNNTHLLSLFGQVIKNTLPHFTLRKGQVSSLPIEEHKVVMAGSFNPVHEGHLGMASITQSLLAPSSEIVFEVGVFNPDKPDLGAEEVARRLEPFLEQGSSVKVCRNRLYFETNQDYRHSWMCIGYDTVIRVFMEKYYPRGRLDIQQGFQNIRQQNNKLVVLGRLDRNTGKFLSFQEYVQQNRDNYIGALYEEFKDIFVEIAEEQFRIDISSTEIREQKSKKE